MPYLISLLVICTFSFQAFARQASNQRDTSFTNYSAFVKAKKAQPFITMANPPTPGNIRAKKDLVYCSYGERKLLLDVFQPANTSGKKLPAVLIIHGGGWRSGDRSQHIPLSEQLAAKGFVVITAEYRLSTEALYPAAVLDLKTCIRWIRANASSYQVDPGRIAVMGYSAGGQLAALLGNTNGSPIYMTKTEQYKGFSDHVQAVVDIDGILSFIHPESAEGDDSKGTSAATYWFGVPKSQNQASWIEASALSHAGKTSAPILFINSSVARMHAGRDDMIRKLDSLHIYSEVHTFNDAPHTFPLFNPWFEPMLGYITDFLKKIFP